MDEHLVTTPGTHSGTDIVTGEDGLPRCWWGGAPEIYREYHDREWGRAVRGDDALFERLCLEAFQSGLSWLTILRRRESFRSAFAGFRIAAIAAFDAGDAARLLADPGIIRNRLKIGATIANARLLAEWPEGRLTELIWSHAPAGEGRPAPRRRTDIPPTTPESLALAKDLKQRGIRFVGPTTAYALMQACGLVNDHLEGCHCRSRARAG